MLGQLKENMLKTLAQFEGLSLADLDRVSLQNRMDTKFVFNDYLLPDVLEKLRLAGYKTLSIDGVRAFRYSSVYFDTDDFSLYGRHAAGKMNRYKVRRRSYVDTGGTFFEIKFKNNRGRTIKSRVGVDSVNDTDNASRLLGEKTPYDFTTLHEQIVVDYTRITLTGPDFKERLTIDTDLTYVMGDRKWSVDGLVVAELKQNRTAASTFSKLMKEYHIRPSSLSKYCLGVAALADNVKKNSFKPQILMVKKIQHDSTSRPRQ
ncbi:MAG: polyphosphate polymerase domain-containing protein [Bacteroidota bacterium]